jgi:hypothetical protein
MESSPCPSSGGSGIPHTEEEEEGGVDDDDDYEDGRNNKFAAAGGRMYNDRKRGRTATPSLINSNANPPITTTTTTIKLPFDAHHYHHHQQQQQQHFMAPPQSAPTTTNINHTATAPPSLFIDVTGDTNNIGGTSFTGDDVATNSNNKMLQSNAAPGTSRLIESSPLVMPSFNTMHHCDNNNNNYTTTNDNIHCHYHYHQSTPLHLDMHRTPVGHGNHHQYQQQQQQHSHHHYDLSMGHHMFGGHHFQAYHNFELPLVPSSVFGIDRPDRDSVSNGNGGDGGRGSGLFFSSPDLEAPPVYTSNNFIGTGTSPFLGMYLHNDDKIHPQVGSGHYGSTNITTTNVLPQLNQTAQSQQQQEQKEEIREIVVDHNTRDTITPPPPAAAAAAYGGDNHKHGSPPSPEEGSVSPACDGKNLLSPSSEEPIEGHHPNNNNEGDNGNGNGQTGLPDNNNNPCDTVGLAVEKSIAPIAVVAIHGDGQQQQQQQYGDASISPLPPTQQQQQHTHHHPDQSLIQKMHQIEKKVSGVEERWGSMHLNAGKAHLLMYHACQHPALAAHYEGRGREALERSFTIMAYNGGREAVEQVEKDIAGGWGGGRE